MKLRLANEGDLEELLRWRNDPKTRYFRPDSREITKEEHKSWLERRQAGESRVWIAERENTPVGNITLDVEESGIQVGWIIAPEHRAKGLGKEMVNEMLRLLTRNIWCKMRADNEASYRLARACGFDFKRTDDGMIYLDYVRMG